MDYATNSEQTLSSSNRDKLSWTTGRTTLALAGLAPDILSISSGCVVFLICFGPHFLLNDAPYLVTPVGDIAAEMAGYFNFAHDTWRFPLFSMPLVNQPEGANQLFIGGVPLLALLAKIIHSVSGRVPNLFGPWFLLCCALQTHSLFFLMRQITHYRPFLLAFASVSGGLAYAFLTRNGHVSLFAQFLCIYAMGFVIAAANDRYSPNRILISLALLVYASMFVFAYIAIMNTALFVAGLASLWQRERISLQKAIITFVAFFVVQIVLSFIGGYFWGAGLAEPVSLSSYGFFGMNLGTLFAPPQSILFPTHEIIRRSWWEGDFYLGLGVIGLWLAIIFNNPRTVRDAIRSHWAIVVILGALLLYSMSNRIAFLDQTLFTVPLPKFLEPFIGMARTSGRLFWPIGYLIIGSAFALTVIQFRRAAPAMISVALILLCLEATGPISYVQYLVKTPNGNPLSYPSLSTLLAGYRSVYTAPSFWCVAGEDVPKATAFHEIEFSASQFGLVSNSAITARKMKDCRKESATPHFPAPGEITFFMSRGAATLAMSERPIDIAKSCRQFRLGSDVGVACSSQSWPKDDMPYFQPVTDLVLPLSVGEKIDFTLSGNSPKYMSGGWSVRSDNDLTWTEGPVSAVEFKLPLDPPSENLHVDVTALVFLYAPEITQRLVSVEVNGQTNDTWNFQGAMQWMTRSIALPQGFNGKTIRIAFRQDASRSPKDIGLNEDPRHLGLGVKTIALVSNSH
jgi:hypothetical protein